MSVFFFFFVRCEIFPEYKSYMGPHMEMNIGYVGTIYGYVFCIVMGWNGEDIEFWYALEEPNRK